MSTTTVDDRPDEPMGDPEDRLPWLESAEEDYRDGPSPMRVVALIVAGLVAVALVIFAINWFRDRGGTVGSGGMIEAPEGDYKIKPDEPGGMKVEGEGDTVFATSEGGAPNGAVDTAAVPEAPVRGKAATTVRPAEKGSARIVTTVPASGGRLEAQAPAIATPRSPQAGGGGSLVQIGSFPSEASASSAWTMLSKRFAYLAPLGKSIEPTEVGGRTYYRLRVNAGSAGQASALCGKLKVAGEACFVPN